MKKKLIALMLALVMLLGLLPAAAPKAEAADLLGLMDIGGKFYNGINKTVSDIKAGKTDNDFLSAFTGTMKNLGCEFAGVDTSSGSSSGSYQQTVIVNEVNLTNIESNLADISNQLDRNNATMNDIKSQIVSAQNSLSSDISDLKSAVLTAIGNSTTAGYYDNYLNTYFTWYNKFLNSVEYCERSLNTNLNAGTPRKNDYNYYYLLQGQTANCYLPAALQTQANYLNGDNQSQLGNMSIVDMLYNYYSFAGRTQEETAALVKEYVKLMYYSYTLACYDYMMLSIYMLGWCKENNQSVYSISADYDRSTAQLRDDLETVLSDYLKTSQTLFEDLYEHFAEVSDISVYAVTPSHCATTYESDGTALKAATGATLYLPNAGDVFSKTMGSDLQELFGDLADFTYSVSGASTSLSGRELKLKSAGTVTVTIKMTLGSTTKEVAKYTVTVKDGYLGKGTEGDPVIIASKDDWNKLASSGEDFNDVACLAADIDFGGGTIQYFSGTFNGTFYGNGHTMKNGKITDGSYYATGLFPATNDASFYDLKLENITVERTTSQSWSNAGVLVGQMHDDTTNPKTPSVSRCSATNCSLTITAGNRECKTMRLGGLVGSANNNTQITDCVVSGTTVQGKNSYIPKNQRTETRTNDGDRGTVYVGGIVGTIDGCPYEGGVVNCGVVNCKLLGNYYFNISYSGGQYVTTTYVGGIAGSVNGSYLYTIHDCWLYMLSGSSEMPTSADSSDGSSFHWFWGDSYIYTGRYAGTTGQKNYFAKNCYYYSGSGYNTVLNSLNALGEGTGLINNNPYSAVSKSNAADLPLGSYVEYASNTMRLKAYTIADAGESKLIYRLNDSYEPDGICVDLLCGGNKIKENIKGYQFTTNFNGKAAGKYETKLTCGNTVTLNPVVYTIVNVLGGDVNGDNKVDLKDVSALFKWWNGKQTLAADKIAAGDYNGNGKTDIRDAAAIYRAVK